FAKDIDQAADPFKAGGPVPIEAAAKAVDVALANRLDDVVVFRHRAMQLVDDGARVQTPVAIDLRPDRVVQLDQSPAASGRDDRGVECLVDIEHPARADWPRGRNR